MQRQDQLGWITRKAREHAGFRVLEAPSYFPGEEQELNLRISHEGIVKGHRRTDDVLTFFSVVYDGELEVVDPAAFKNALERGIGHGKAFGLGLLTVAEPR